MPQRDPFWYWDNTQDFPTAEMHEKGWFTPRSTPGRKSFDEHSARVAASHLISVSVGIAWAREGDSGHWQVVVDVASEAERGEAEEWVEHFYPEFDVLVRARDTYRCYRSDIPDPYEQSDE